MRFLLFIAYAAAASAGHCRQGGRPKSSPQPVSSSSSKTTSSVPTATSSVPLAGAGLDGGMNNPKMGAQIADGAGLGGGLNNLGMGGEAASLPETSTASGGALKASFTKFDNHSMRPFSASRLTEPLDMVDAKPKQWLAASSEATMPLSRRTYPGPAPAPALAQLAILATL